MKKLLGFLFGVSKPKGGYNADATRSIPRQPRQKKSGKKK